MGANKLLISVVDDDAAIRKALLRLLSSADMNVATFDSGQAFLDSLANQSPDCLILDLHMPGISGLEVLQGLSRIDEAVPTIVITAYDERAMECLAAGAQTYCVSQLMTRYCCQLSKAQPVLTPVHWVVNRARDT